MARTPVLWEVKAEKSQVWMQPGQLSDTLFQNEREKGVGDVAWC